MSELSIEAAGAALAVREEGAGPATVVVHDIGGRAAVPSSGRVLTYARRGYGASTAPEGYRATTVEEQAEDLAALVAACGAAPALLLGDGFGALVALDVAKRHPDLVRGLVLADTPLHAFVPAATQVMAERRSAMELALREGGPLAAMRAGGVAEPDARDAAAFFADYAGLSSWPVTRRELRAIVAPTAVVTRPGAPAHVLAASDALAALLPLAERVVDGDPATVAAGR